MAFNEVDICNLALALVGEKPIDALNDGSDAGRICGTYYELTRDEVLRSHRWNFATKRAALSQLADAPVFEYNYAYQLPSDFIRAVDINKINVFDVLSNFSIESGRRLLSNEQTINLQYIFREADVTKFDPLFVDALALKLGSKISTSLSEEPGISQGLLQEYVELTAPLAKQIDATENRPGLTYQPSRSRLVRSRRTIGAVGATGSGSLQATNGRSSGGGQSGDSVINLNDLLDVDDSAKADQYVLTWDEASQLWIAQVAAAGGDFSGPASAVNNNFVAFDGTGGKTGQDSGVSAASLAIVKQWGISSKAVITTGLKDAYITIPCTGTITKWELFSDVVGDLVLDLWKDTYGNFPPTVADSITASAKPTLSSADKNTDSTLTGWTTAVVAGDKILINVDSAATVKQAVLELYITPTA